jgi:hypothetical protein
LRDRAALGALLWPTGDADAQGYEEIEARAASAYEHWVGSEGLRGVTTPSGSATSSSSTGRRSAKDGEAFGVGAQLPRPAADGRIERDYTFVVSGMGAALLAEQEGSVGE